MEMEAVRVLTVCLLLRLSLASSRVCGDLRWVEFGQENSASEIDWLEGDNVTYVSYVL